MDFALSPEVTALRDRVAEFVRTEIIPHEMKMDAEGRLPAELVAELRGKVKAAGLWAPHLPVEYGGQGLDMMAMAAIFEQLGKCQIAPYLFNCDAPDEGNMHLMIEYGSPYQIEKYARPLIAGAPRWTFAKNAAKP